MEEIRVYTVDEARKILQVGRRTFYNYLKAGQIKAVKVGGEWRISHQALKEFTEKGTDKNYYINMRAKRQKTKERKEAKQAAPETGKPSEGE